MENSLRKSAINYGLYIGVILSAFTIIGYIVDLTILTKWWLGLILFLVILALGIVSVAKGKSILGGFMSFKQAFTSWFLTIVVGLVISTTVNILIFNIVDPEAAEILKEMTIESAVSMMENFNAPQSEIDKAVADMENDNQFGAVNLLKSLVYQFLFYAVIGLIVAAVMKKKDPDAA